MDTHPDRPPRRRAARYGLSLAHALGETLWPTRCAVCDAPETLLCARCRLHLPYIDQNRTCPRCGAPQGQILCTECNAITLASLGRSTLPFARSASSVVFDQRAARLVRIYKDQGERRLADVLAGLMADTLPPSWAPRAPLPGNRPVPATRLTFIPATHAALRRRGFDHAELLAAALGSLIGIPVAQYLARPESKDQRSLSRAGRLTNMKDRFTLSPSSDPFCPHLLLIDDVYTTGATLAGAADTLLAHRAEQVSCLTFARVW